MNAISTDLPRTRILVADDDGSYLAAAAMLLRASGFDVTAAHDGNHALLAIDVSLLAKRPYDLLILDVRMPGLTGWEVLAESRKRVLPGMAPPRALLMTGFTVELDLDRCRSEGAAGILLKPFTNNALVNEVRRVLSIPRVAA